MGDLPALQPHGGSSVSAQCLSFTGSRIFDYRRQTLVADGISAVFPSWCEGSKEYIKAKVFHVSYQEGTPVCLAVEGNEHPTALVSYWQ